MPGKDHLNRNLEEAATILQALGKEGTRNLATNLPSAGIKYGDLSLGQVQALINHIGQDRIQQLLQGDITLHFGKGQKALFNGNGWRIPKKNLRSSVAPYDVRTVTCHRFNMTGVNCEYALDNLQAVLGKDVGITASDFQSRAERLIDEVKTHNRVIGDILHAPHLPIVMPAGPEHGNDSTTLFKHVVDGLSKSWSGIEILEKRAYTTSWEGLGYQAHILCHSSGRQMDLTVRRKYGPVVGIFFPNCLSGYSIAAARNQMSELPEGFILSGFDVPIAAAMHPTRYAPSRAVLTTNMAGIYWSRLGREVVPFFKETDGDRSLIFSQTDNIEQAHEGASCGLLFIGEESE